MSTLSPEERALLDEARKGWTASPDVTRSVRAGIAERLRADPTFGMDAPGPATAASAVRFPLGRLLKSPVAVVSALAIVGAGAYFVARREAPPSAPTASGTVVVPSAPAAPPPAETAAPEIGTVAIDSLPSAKAAPSAKKPATSSRTDTIAEEVALVGAAQRSLRDGSPGDALSTLSAHASRFPNGALREERMALQVLASCELGDLPKARRIRAELEQLAPSSSHLQRLGCAAP